MDRQGIEHSRPKQGYPRGAIREQALVAGLGHRNAETCTLQPSAPSFAEQLRKAPAGGKA